MKKEIFDNIEVFKNQVENLKSENRFFFIDKRNLSIYTNDMDESFLNFYLYILVNVICSHNYNEVSSFTSTCYYFYVSKSFIEYSKKDLNIMLSELGMNFDDYDLEYTDNIGIIY